MFGLGDLGSLISSGASALWDALPDVGGMFAPGGGGGGYEQGLGWLSLLGTGAGVGSQIYGAMNANNASNKLYDLSKKPLDPMQFYQAMGNAERQSLGRSIKADMATRGIPYDGGYGTALSSEIMAGRDTDRFKAALDAALNQRQLQLGGYGMAGRLNQGNPGVGDASSLGNYMRWRAARAGRDAAGVGGGSNRTPTTGTTMQWDTEMDALGMGGAQGPGGYGNINPYSAGGGTPGQQGGSMNYEDFYGNGG